MTITAWRHGNTAQKHKLKCGRFRVEAGAAGMILRIWPTGSSGTGTATRKRQGRTPACQDSQK